MSVNKVLLLGRLGQDPENKFLPTGHAVCNFTLATSEKWKDKSGTQQEKTEWSRCVVFGKLAETCGKYLSKGKEIFAEGKLQTRSWDDKNGEKRYITEINVSTIQFIGSRSESGNSEASKPENNNISGSFTSDDIPF